MASGVRESPYAAASIVERHHTENNARWDAHRQEHKELEREVSYLVQKDRQNDERLGAGARTMTKLEEQIERVNQKIQWPAWKVVAYICSVLVPALFAIGAL